MPVRAESDPHRLFEDILIQEACLLDEGRFEEWLELFAEETRYWAPVRANLARGEETLDQLHRLTHFDDSRETLALRVQRLLTGFAHAEEPPSRTRHFVSNVRVLDMKAGDRAQVASNVLVFRSRGARDEQLFSCSRRDSWRHTAKGWKNEERLIIFDHDVIENLTTFF